MDFRELLKKYITHVGEVEGTSFLQNRNRYEVMSVDNLFTDEEWAELRKLNKEAVKEASALWRETSTQITKSSTE